MFKSLSEVKDIIDYCKNKGIKRLKLDSLEVEFEVDYSGLDQQIQQISQEANKEKEEIENDLDLDIAKKMEDLDINGSKYDKKDFFIAGLKPKKKK